MKFTKAFETVLKNFSVISPEMYFVEGNVQSVLIKGGTTFASSKTDVVIEKPFAIKDIKKLLSILSVFEEPNINVVDDRYLEISDEGKMVQYQLTKPDFIIYEKNLDRYSKFKADISFKMTHENYNDISKIYNILGSEEFLFEGNGSEVFVRAVRENVAGDAGSVFLDQTGEVFKVFVNLDKLRLQDNDYVVNITKKGAINFHSDDSDYFVAFNKKKSVL